jgi:hypothetical protein
LVICSAMHFAYGVEAPDTGLHTGLRLNNRGAHH